LSGAATAEQSNDGRLWIAALNGHVRRKPIVKRSAKTTRNRRGKVAMGILLDVLFWAAVGWLCVYL